MIKLNKITKYYGQHKVLDDVTLHVKSGSIFGIIGASGAGKSTFIRCMNLLERPDHGKVIINGTEITRLGKQALRKSRQRMGMIFQHFNLLSNRTVFENIALPLEFDRHSKADIKKAVTPLLSLTGLKERADHYPAQLSGGQKQRVAIARALVSQPEILLCDELTSALDPNTTKSILSLIKDIKERLGLTVVLITHEMDVARAICDEIAVMSNGKIIERNTVEEIFLNPENRLTRQFVHSVTHENKLLNDKDTSLGPKSGACPVLRLAFVGERAQTPIITRMAKKFDVDFSILHGDIETINNKSMGFIIVKMIGPSEALPSVINHLQEQKLTVEIVGYEQ